MMKFDEIKIGDILYKYEELEFDDGTTCNTPVVDKVIDIELKPYPAYRAFIRFQNSCFISVYTNDDEILNIFKTEQELIEHIQEEIKKSIKQIK